MLYEVITRIAAYTGKQVTWEEMMNSDLYLGPKTYAFGPVPEISNPVPLGGEANKWS